MILLRHCVLLVSSVGTLARCCCLLCAECWINVAGYRCVVRENPELTYCCFCYCSLECEYCSFVIFPDLICEVELPLICSEEAVSSGPWFVDLLVRPLVCIVESCVQVADDDV